MNDLDQRLRTLAPPSGEPSADLHDRAASLRTRATGRRARRRRRGLALVAVPAVIVVAAATAALVRDDDHESVRAGSDPVATTTTSPATAGEGASQHFGGSEGISLTVTPRTGLIDGDVVEVQIDGLDKLDTPLLVMCAGDVQAETITQDCDLRSLDRTDPTDPTDPNNSGAMGPVEHVTVRRMISIPRQAETNPTDPPAYDCATESAGCVLAVGDSTLPPTGAYVPLEFDRTAPQTTPTIEATPTTGLGERQQISVTATGLRPNSIYRVRQCSTAKEAACDETEYPYGRTDAEGRFALDVTARAVLYSWRGRTDCTAVPCEIQITDDTGDRYAAAALTFAPDVEPAVPELQLSPAGPYHDDQEITVTGTGFPPGLDIVGQIGQCPADLDTAVEERCTRPALALGLGDPGPPVADDGTFSLRIRLSETLTFTGSCRGEPGCHIGWVLPHGPTVATAPLTFAP